MSDFLREQVAVYPVPDYFQRKGQDFVAKKVKKLQEKPNQKRNTSWEENQNKQNTTVSLWG